MACRTPPGLDDTACGQTSILWRHGIGATPEGENLDQNSHVLEGAMSQGDNQVGQSVALYWDFGNLHASLVEANSGDGSYGEE